MNRIHTLKLSLMAATLLAATAAGAAVPTRLLGEAAPVAQATRTITINEDTRYINVHQGDVVRFVAGDRDFAFNFDSPGAEAFNLQRVAPAGALNHRVMAYVSPVDTDELTVN